MGKGNTTAHDYTERLVRLEHARWKAVLDVQRPYRWNINRLKPGRTLDIGCGIGRHLRYLPAGSVGVDHNRHSIKYVRTLGLEAYGTRGFMQRTPKPVFDSLLLSHVLEHMTADEGVKLLRSYGPWLKKDGQVIICCPQEKGYASDATHVTFLDPGALADILTRAGFSVTKSYSFPLPRFTGKFFLYNEFIVVGTKDR